MSTKMKQLGVSGTTDSLSHQPNFFSRNFPSWQQTNIVRTRSSFVQLCGISNTRFQIVYNQSGLIFQPQPPWQWNNYNCRSDYGTWGLQLWKLAKPSAHPRENCLEKADFDAFPIQCILRYSDLVRQLLKRMAPSGWFLMPIEGSNGSTRWPVY